MITGNQKDRGKKAEGMFGVLMMLGGMDIDRSENSLHLQRTMFTKNDKAMVATDRQ